MQLALVEGGSPPIPAPDLRRTYEQHHALVFRTAYRITGNAADAEDVLQTVFLRLLRRDSAAAELEQPESYLRRAAINVSVTLLHDRRKRAPAPLEEAEEAARTPGGSLGQELRAALAALPPRHAEMFVLRFVEGYSNAEIGRLFDMSSVNVAVTLFRIRQRLQKELSR